MTDTGQLRDVLDATQAFYRGHVYKSWAFKELRERMLAGVVNRGQVGYAPPGWTTLVDHLRGLGHSDQAMIDAGVAVTASTGNVIDLMRDRMMFPIRDPEGDLVGFTGRCAAGAEKVDRGPDRSPTPKYINTPATPLFRKSQVLYGLDAGADALAGGAWPVLVEGPLDRWAVALEADTHKIPIVPLATCGTALTSEHLRVLDAYTTKPLTFCFDGDQAGQAALARGWELVTDAHPERSHRALVFPVGKDPAELYASGRGNLARQLMSVQPAAHAVATHRLTGAGELDHAGAVAHMLEWLGQHDLARIPSGDVAAYISHVSAATGTDILDVNAALLAGRFKTTETATAAADPFRSDAARSLADSVNTPRPVHAANRSRGIGLER